MKKIIALFLGAGLLLTACESKPEPKVEKEEVVIVQNISPQEFQDKISNGEVQLIDVRTQKEFEAGHIKNAENLDILNGQLLTGIRDLDETKPIYVYCKAGARGIKAGQLLKENGFKTIYNLKGGTSAWEGAKLPLVLNEEIAQMSTSEFDSITNSSEIVLIDFYAPWCKPCKQMHPVIDEIKNEYEGKVKVVKINHDESKPINETKNINSIPMFFIYQNGKEVWSILGAQDKSLFTHQLDSLLNS